MVETPTENSAHRADKALNSPVGNYQRLRLLLAGVLLPLWGFAGIAYNVHGVESFLFDNPLLLKMQQWSSTWLDQCFVIISLAGYQYLLVPLDIAIVLALAFYKRWREFTFATVSFIGSAVLNQVGKYYFQRVRPALWESIAPETTYSFPSGHAMGSVTLAAVVIALSWHTRWRWWVLWPMSSFTGLVGISRVYLGVHYPTDVLAGWAAGIMWVSAIYLLVFYSQRRPWCTF